LGNGNILGEKVAGDGNCLLRSLITLLENNESMLH